MRQSSEDNKKLPLNIHKILTLLQEISFLTEGGKKDEISSIFTKIRTVAGSYKWV